MCPEHKGQSIWHLPAHKEEFLYKSYGINLIGDYNHHSAFPGLYKSCKEVGWKADHPWSYPKRFCPLWAHVFVVSLLSVLDDPDWGCCRSGIDPHVWLCSAPLLRTGTELEVLGKHWPPTLLRTETSLQPPSLEGTALLCPWASLAQSSFSRLHARWIPHPSPKW